MDGPTALQTFKNHLNIPGIKADFPDIDFVVSELEDGQQEIIIRLQGEDPGFRPAADLAAIDSMTLDDIRMFDVKNSTTLAREKHLRKKQRLRLRDIAICKRVKQLFSDAGVKPGRVSKTIKEYLAFEGIE